MIKTYDDALAFSKANLDAAILSGNKLSAGLEEVAKEVFGYAGKAFDSVVEIMKVASACKTPVEVFQVQQKFAKDAVESVVGELGKLNEMGTVIAKSAAEPIQGRYKAVFEGFGK